MQSTISKLRYNLAYKIVQAFPRKLRSAFIFLGQYFLYTRDRRLNNVFLQPILLLSFFPFSFSVELTDCHQIILNYFLSLSDLYASAVICDLLSFYCIRYMRERLCSEYVCMQPTFIHDCNNSNEIRLRRVFTRFVETHCVRDIDRFAKGKERKEELQSESKNFAVNHNVKCKCWKKRGKENEKHDR